jgi:predicted acyl esterase
VTVEYDVPATMRDGTVLRADVYRPASGGPHPVLLARLPYGKNFALVSAMVDPLALARGGFIVVIQDTRGRYASDGEWEPWTHEADDGYDTVRWAAALPDTNGRVGMIGASYFGNTQWMAALSKPPELQAIAPQITFSEPNDGLFARGGAIELGITLPWSLMQGVDTLMKRHADDPAALGPALGALIHDMDRTAPSGYWELPSGRPPPSGVTTSRTSASNARCTIRSGVRPAGSRGASVPVTVCASTSPPATSHVGTATSALARPLTAERTSTRHARRSRTTRHGPHASFSPSSGLDALPLKEGEIHRSPRSARPIPGERADQATVT